MNLLDEIKTINKSAVGAQVALAFLVGYAIPLTTMLGPYFVTTDYVGAIIRVYRECLTNQAWLLIFFKSTMNSGVGFTIGSLMRTNAFDWFKKYFPSAAHLEEITPDQLRSVDLTDK